MSDQAKRYVSDVRSKWSRIKDTKLGLVLCADDAAHADAMCEALNALEDQRRAEAEPYYISDNSPRKVWRRLYLRSLCECYSGPDMSGECRAILICDLLNKHHATKGGAG